MSATSRSRSDSSSSGDSSSSSSHSRRGASRRSESATTVPRTTSSSSTSSTTSTTSTSSSSSSSTRSSGSSRNLTIAAASTTAADRNTTLRDSANLQPRGGDTLRSTFAESLVFEEQGAAAVSSASVSPSLAPQLQAPSHTLAPSPSHLGVSNATMGESLVFEEVAVTPSRSGLLAVPQKSFAMTEESIVFQPVTPSPTSSPVPSTTTTQHLKVPASGGAGVSSSSVPSFRETVATIATGGESLVFEEIQEAAVEPAPEPEPKPEPEPEKPPAAAAQWTEVAEHLRKSPTPPRRRERSPDRSGSGSTGATRGRPSAVRHVDRGYARPRVTVGNGSDAGGSGKGENEPTWQKQLRGSSSGKRNSSVPAWQVVNQTAVSPRSRRDEGGAYHGCSFGPPPHPVVTKPGEFKDYQREKGAFSQLRGIDTVRRELVCGKLAKDCTVARREGAFDPSGGVASQRNLTGTFPPLPPVKDEEGRRTGRRVGPDLTGVTSRFREWERSITPPARRSRTPTRSAPQPWKITTGRTSAPTSPRRKEDVIRKLQDENKKLQRAIEKMKSKMQYLEEVSGQQMHSGAAARERSPSPCGAPRSTSLPKRISTSGTFQPASRARTVTRSRGVVGGTPLDPWARTTTPDTSLERINNTYSGFTPPKEVRRSRDGSRGRLVRRTSSSQSKGLSRTLSDATPTESMVAAAVAPTLESRIQTLEAIQKDVRAALGRDRGDVSCNATSIPMSVQELRNGTASTATDPPELPLFDPVPSPLNEHRPARRHYSPMQAIHHRRPDAKLTNKQREQTAILRVLKPRWM